MVLALVIGDMHIPHRAADLPTKFKELLVPGKIQHVICTGNLCSKDALDWLKGLCGGGTSALHVVEGDFDDDFTTLPQSKVVNIGDFRIGVTHGHAIVPWGDIEALKSVQRYAKTAFYLRAEAETPVRVTKFGSRRLARLGGRAEFAVN